ncbi:MAG: class I SAM-dependent rRNA methyltransferase [Gammaproteobacteria bacterium]
MAYSSVWLKKNEDHRLKQGHLWIYSNEIDVSKSPLKQFQSGEMVQILNAQGKSLGLGYINPHTLLAARLLTRSNTPFDQIEIISRIRQALVLRERLYAKPYYRLIYGESDFLPGLIVDRYADLLVVQITTAGMERLQSAVIEALVSVIQPKSILLRNDHSMRALEGLPEQVIPAWGSPPEEVVLEENQVAFCIDPWKGQKTGWFYDHRDNRARLKPLVAGKRVLDLFSYVGGWAIQAAVAGAESVCAVDSSAAALERLQHNAKLNRVEERVRTLQGDVFEQLKQLAQDAALFDVIIIDPPAFIKKRKDLNAGLLAYRRVNELALRLLAPEGLLVSASCSQHLSAEALRDVVLQAGLKRNYTLQLIAQGHQGGDHPIHLAIPETEYLKALFMRAGRFE